MAVGRHNESWKNGCTWKISAIAPSKYIVGPYHARQAAFTGGFVILGIWMILSGGQGEVTACRRMERHQTRDLWTTMGNTSNKLYSRRGLCSKARWNRSVIVLTPLRVVQRRKRWLANLLEGGEISAFGCFKRRNFAAFHVDSAFEMLLVDTYSFLQLGLGIHRC
jgi:hypothetical protein